VNCAKALPYDFGKVEQEKVLPGEQAHEEQLHDPARMLARLAHRADRYAPGYELPCRSPDAAATTAPVVCRLQQELAADAMAPGDRGQSPLLTVGIMRNLRQYATEI
jgi:hypothetical protein